MGSKLAMTISHPQLGNVNIKVSDRAKRVTARWKGGEVSMTVPRRFSSSNLSKAIAELAPKLIAIRPAQLYSEGKRIQCPEVTFVLRRQSFRPETVIARPELPTTYLEVGSDIDFDSPGGMQAVSNMLCRLTFALAERLLLERAQSIAARVGATPGGWKIGRGRKVLGTCDIRGVITLSHLLVFLPLELRDYIVCHELAHLLEMNHSPRFHEICNSYCGGNEARLQSALRRFKWPIIR